MITGSLLRCSLLCLVLFSSYPLFGQDTSTDATAAQKAWMDYMTPGPAHKMMAESVGEWTYKMKMWLSPGGEPMLSEGTSSVEMFLGGRYLKAIRKGSMMGMPFEGWSLMGYDNLTKEVTVVWYDNMGTGTAVAKGTYDKPTNTVTVHGSFPEPVSGKDIAFKEVFKFSDKDNQSMEYFNIKDGKEIKFLEVAYVRSK